jgi:nucleotide-binding universal stress UspA family protein
VAHGQGHQVFLYPLVGAKLRASFDPDRHGFKPLRARFSGRWTHNRGSAKDEAVPIRTSEVVWEGNLEDGKGIGKLGSGVYSDPFKEEEMSMRCTMMISLDGASHTAGAIDMALVWAKRLNALIAAVGVMDDTIRGPDALPMGQGEFSMERDAKLLFDAHQRVKEALQRIDVRCREAGVECRVAEVTGVPHEQIVLEAQRYDLVLLGQPTDSDFELGEPFHKTVGSVLKSSPRPAVVVPGNYREGSGILIAYDGSLQAARALQALIASGLHALGEIRVLSIDDKSSDLAAERAGRAVEYLGFHDVTATAQPMVSKTPVEHVIRDEAENWGAELVVMGAYGRATLTEFLLGSVTSKVLKESRTPLFLFH